MGKDKYGVSDCIPYPNRYAKKKNQATTFELKEAYADLRRKNNYLVEDLMFPKSITNSY